MQLENIKPAKGEISGDLIKTITNDGYKTVLRFKIHRKYPIRRLTEDEEKTEEKMWDLFQEGYLVRRLSEIINNAEKAPKMEQNCIDMLSESDIEKIKNGQKETIETAVKDFFSVRGAHERFTLDRHWRKYHQENSDEYYNWLNHFRKNLEIVERKDNKIEKIEVEKGIIGAFKQQKTNHGGIMVNPEDIDNATKWIKEWTIEKGVMMTRHRKIRYGRIKRQRCIVEGFYSYIGQMDDSLQVKIRFVTNNRIGRALPEELVPWGSNAKA